MSMITVCTPYIRLKDGTVKYASEYGLKAFCFEVTEEAHQEYWAKRGKKPPQSGSSKK